MKTFFTIIAVLALTVTAHAQSQTNVTHDVTINVNSSTNLNCSALRITIQDCAFDKATWVPVLTINVEAWGDDIDSGVTNKVIVAKKSLTLTRNQLKVLLNSADPQSAFKAAILARAKLTEK